MSEAASIVEESLFGEYVIFPPPTLKPTTLSEPPTPKPTAPTEPPTPKPAVTGPPTPKPTTLTQPPTPKPTALSQPPTPKPTAVTQPPTPRRPVSQPPTPFPSASPTFSLLPTVLPSGSPTATQSPSYSPSKQCEDCSDLVRIVVTLGGQPCDLYWDLRDQRGDKIIVDVRYEVKDQTIVREVCKPSEDCYLFRLVRTNDASALIFLNGKEIAKATTEEEIKVGDSCFDSV